MRDQRFNIIVLLLLFFMIIPLKAQVSRCALNLIEAKKQYNAGQIEEVPGLLLDCIESGFSKEERIEAYKLLIVSYIFDDYPDQAEKYMLQFLNEFPEYNASDEDPFEFVNLFEQYDNSPKFSAGLNLGTNLSMVRVTEPFGVYNTNNVSGNYSIAPGFIIGGNLHYFLDSKYEISIEALFSSTAIKYEVDPFPFTTTKYTESQQRIETPLSLVYSFNDKNISPYARIGFKPSLLVSSKSESERTYSGTDGVIYETILGESINISDKRIPLQISALMGGGLRYSVNKDYFFIDVRYNLGFTSQVDPSSRQDPDDDNTWLFYNVQDDFKLSDLSFTIGYSRIFYKPKRKN